MATFQQAKRNAITAMVAFILPEHLQWQLLIFLQHKTETRGKYKWIASTRQWQQQPQYRRQQQCSNVMVAYELDCPIT